MSRPRRPAPADFAQIAPELSMEEACQRFAAGYEIVTRWHKEAGTSSRGRYREPPRSEPQAMPDWFPALARERVAVIQAAHPISGMLIGRFRKMLGIDMAVVRRERAAAAAEARAAAAPAPPPKPQRRRGHWGPKAPATVRDDTRAGIAADDLRRAGYMPVCRAKIRDPKAAADLWIVGRRTLTTAEMIDLAAERGARATWPPTTLTTSTGART